MRLLQHSNIVERTRTREKERERERERTTSTDKTPLSAARRTGHSAFGGCLVLLPNRKTHGCHLGFKFDLPLFECLWCHQRSRCVSRLRPKSPINKFSVWSSVYMCVCVCVCVFRILATRWRLFKDETRSNKNGRAGLTISASISADLACSTSLAFVLQRFVRIASSRSW